MYLQSLELFGFKSFAAKTTLNFHRGVTAVVGPNGCGKSNVLDAIRWVLGEQSAKALRGGEMADVIFSGTDSRPALGMAEVSLTFAECEKDLGVEYNEVRITRRVFRDGASEYLLNKTPCRLRDIQQLFMDTGIGRSAYSIMEQGKIDLILSSRPEDRRAIFEEAAGITRFKSQKKEALRKLDATEANLLRVTDIIKEVKRQIGSLQRQAAKARRYQSLIADLKTLESHNSRRQFDDLDAALSASREEIERLRVLQGEHELQIEQQEAQVADQRHGLEEMESSLGAARQTVQELRSRIANAESRLGFNAERIMECASLIERYQRDIAAAEEKLQVQETQIQNTDLELEQISQSLQFEQGRLNEKTEAVRALTSERMSAEQSAQEVFGSISRLENRLSSLRNEIGNAISRRDGGETRLGILNDEIRMLGETADRLAAQCAETNAQVEQGVQALQNQQLQLQEEEAMLRGIQSEVQEMDQRIVAEQRTLAEKESKLEVLRQLNEEGEGFAKGTQTVLRGLDNPEFFKPSILGALAAFIEVEPEFIGAIEAALGQDLQAVVMKDVMVAEAVIKTLTAHKSGRASLALREFQMAPASEPIPLPEGAIAWAVDRVKSAPDLQPLVSRLLDRVAIVSNLETALRLKRNDVSFVTLAGEVLTSNGILQGGQAGEAGSSMLQRKNQIAQLEGEAASARALVADLNLRRGGMIEQLETAQARLADVRQEIQNSNVLVSTLRGQLSLLERERGEVTKKTESMRWERSNIETQHEEAVRRLASLEQELAGASAQLAELQGNQSEYQLSVESLRAAEAELSGELNEMRIKVATERQRHNSLANQRQPMAARLLELRELISHRQSDISGYENRAASLEAESERISGEIEAARGQVAEAEQNVSALVEERAAMVAAVEGVEGELRGMRRQLSEIHDKRGQHEVKQTQLQLRIENLCEHVQRRYQIDIREFRPDSYALITTLREHKKQRSRKGQETSGEAAPESEGAEGSIASQQPEVAEPPQEQGIDWAFAEMLISEMSQRLDSMGPINIDAIQEYDELEQRYNFLEQQFADLTNSKAELIDVINKINQTTRKLFAETFEQIRVNFQEMFVELFGGGKANLVLTDESDPLESGIDIIAKPPGKQLQSISLLSGGEKTMTAVAMLFSIYMVKPSPFCVLDEMDAPLDESNINRFIKILDRFVSQSQFVVITHNKRTIAKADVLYGVTMEEHGVSKLVGVKLTRRDESHQSNDIIGTANPVAVPSIAESFGKSGDLHSETIQAG